MSIAKLIRGCGGQRACFAALAMALASAGCGGNDPSSPPVANTPPTLAVQPDTTGAVGGTLRLQAQATDAEHDQLRYSATIIITLEEFRRGYLPAGGINQETGAFWFRPGRDDVPRRMVVFTVDDLRGGRDSTTFTVAVPSAMENVTP